MKTRQAPKLFTRRAVRADFNRRGVTISAWAADRGYHPEAVGDLLRGKTKGLRGQSHNIAVLLGIKAGVVNDKLRPARRSYPKGPK